MIKPRALRPGDRVAVVAPASPFLRDEFARGLLEIEALGFVPTYDESVFAVGKGARSYVAGSPELRAEAVMRAWRDPTVAGLISARGGYGSAEMLPLLDPDEARRARKPFIGYSDATSILTFLTMQCGLVSFHGPMLAGRLSEGVAGYDRDSFERVVCRNEPAGDLTPPGLESVQSGEASGPLLGGNLTQILASLSTPFAFDPPSGYVLFLEEVGERPYRLDRMIIQLRQTGLLGRASGVIFGELPRCDEPSGQPTARGVVAELFAESPIPVIVGFPSGHTVGPAMTLPLGVRCRVVADGRPRVVVEEAAVA
jgi:muramoyltetrapeptide carboxypeptidase